MPSPLDTRPPSRQGATRRVARGLAERLARSAARRVAVLTERLLASPRTKRLLSSYPRLDAGLRAATSAPAEPEPIIAEGIANPRDEPQLELPLEAALERHLRQIVGKRVAQLTANRDPFVASDPIEGVHDLRVASRRLRAFVSVYGPLLDPDAKRIAKDLRRITRSIGTLREWDVHAEHLAQYKSSSSSDRERAAIEYLLEQVDAQRIVERQSAVRRLGKIDFERLAARIDQALDQACAGPASTSVTEFAHSALEPLAAHAVDTLPPDDGSEHARAMHELRIALKKLRYAYELLEPVLGADFQSLHGLAKGLQDLLGDHHDRIVLDQLVDRARVELAARGRKVLAGGLTKLGKRLVEERRELFLRFAAERQTLERVSLTAGLGTRAPSS